MRIKAPFPKFAQTRTTGLLSGAAPILEKQVSMQKTEQIAGNGQQLRFGSRPARENNKRTLAKNQSQTLVFYNIRNFMGKGKYFLQKKRILKEAGAEFPPLGKAACGLNGQC
jgi:hypothetical protein